MTQGTVVRKMDKGFGFIQVEGQEKDLFFHSSELQGVEFDEIQEGETVQFEVESDEKGPRAVGVSRLEGGAEAPASDEEAAA